MLVEFAREYHGVTFAQIDAEQLGALLLETIPAQVAVEEDEAERIVAAARELMRFAEELGSTTAAEGLAMLDGGFTKASRPGAREPGELRRRQAARDGRHRRRIRHEHGAGRRGLRAGVRGRGDVEGQVEVEDKGQDEVEAEARDEVEGQAEAGVEADRAGQKPAARTKKPARGKR